MEEQAKEPKRDPMIEKRNEIVSRFRTPRTEPHPTSKAMENPAPPWVPILVDAIFENCLGSPVGRASLVWWAIEWCLDGDPVQRAEQLVTLLRAWIGPRNVMVEAFLRAAYATKGGAAKDRKPRDPWVVIIPREWPAEPSARDSGIVRVKREA